MFPNNMEISNQFHLTWKDYGVCSRNENLVTFVILFLKLMNAFVIALFAKSY